MLLFGGINEVNADPLTYEVVGDTVTIKDCKEAASGVLAIPSSYEGKPVTRIAEALPVLPFSSRLFACLCFSTTEYNSTASTILYVKVICWVFSRVKVAHFPITIYLPFY